MKNFTLILFAFAAVSLGAFYALVRIRSEMGLGSVVATAPSPVEKHQVSAKMLEASLANQGKQTPDFETVASDGLMYDRDQLIKNGPFIVIFIKESCPCSEEAEPFFRKLYDAVAGKIQIVGVIDGNLTAAMNWANSHKTPYPVLTDPASQIIKGLGAENSAYVALVNSEGITERLWPGYSAPMLKELVEKVGEIVGQTVGPIDVTGAPSELYSGCPYF